MPRLVGGWLQAVFACFQVCADGLDSGNDLRMLEGGLFIPQFALTLFVFKAAHIAGEPQERDERNGG